MHGRLQRRAHRDLDTLGAVVRDPADHKWLTRALVAAILVDGFHGLGLRWPEVSPTEHAANLEARMQLDAETAVVLVTR